MDELTDKDVTEFSIHKASPTIAQVEQPQVSRKMRMNINGNDTGWVNVTEENEAQYNQMLDYINTMHQQMNERFKTFFSRPMTELLDFDFPSLNIDRSINADNMAKLDEPTNDEGANRRT